MAILTKANIASILVIETTDISDYVYNWALQQFYVLAGVKTVSTAKTYRKFIGSDTEFLKLPDKNISTITTLKVDNVSKTFTLNTDLFYNRDTGMVKYSSGFSAGEYIEIAYTIAAYTHDDKYNFLLALLVLKGIAIFTPQFTNQVESIKIGKYSKNFGAVQGNMDDYLKALDEQIAIAISIIKGDDTQLSFGQIN
jgi:hypothetical protein